MSCACPLSFNFSLSSCVSIMYSPRRCRRSRNFCMGYCRESPAGVDSRWRCLAKQIAPLPDLSHRKLSLRRYANYSDLHGCEWMIRILVPFIHSLELFPLFAGDVDSMPFSAPNIRRAEQGSECLSARSALIRCWLDCFKLKLGTVRTTGFDRLLFSL